MQKLTLSTPITIDGKEVKELPYNLDAITIDQLIEADAARAQAHPQSNALQKMAEFDNTLHLYVGMFAIIAANPKIDINDLRRVKGFDATQLMKVGRNFFMRQSASAPGDETEPSLSSSDSDEQSEITPEPLDAQ
jgi:hypothetical protein